MTEEHAVDHHNDPESIRKEMRKYWIVFGGLAIGTAVTVGAFYGLKDAGITVGAAIAVALFIACIKATLVAGFFMHLFSEKKLIYAVLILTVFFFAVLLWGPWNHWYDALGHK